MKTIVRIALLAASFSLSFSACVPQNPPGGPPTTVDGGAAPVNCFSGVEQSAIADAVARVDTVIASGVTGGSAETVILKNLEGLAVDLGPAAFACALQYVSAKFKFDAEHSAGVTASTKDAESRVARDYLARHRIVFATPAP